MKANATTLAVLENIAFGVIQSEQGGKAKSVWEDIRDKRTNYKQQYMDAQPGPSPGTSQPSTPRNQPQPSPATPVPALGANGRKYKKSKNKAQVHLKEIAQILQKYAN